ncbi:MAG: hypothetical protein ACRER8_11995 [Pseudomonas sp.]|uniref:hypothetical protein n=1 Tax=Pseudomonas sp. TaxID=306 RepID=UPI003D6EDEB3
MPNETQIDLPRPMAYVTREDARNLEAGIADCILMMREQTGRFERPVYASPEQSNAAPTRGKVEALGEVAIIQCGACRSEFALEGLEANDGCCPACDSDIDLGGYVTRLQAENAALQQRLNVADQRVDDLETMLNTPHTAEWFEGVRLEAGHQIGRWGTGHDSGKAPADWFWLIGYLAQKAMTAQMYGDDEKARHHTISTGAVMLNWFRAIVGDSAAMRPGIEKPAA